MQEFTIGQRWVSAGELHLGIGLVLAVEFRTVSIIYPATGETRVYAKESAPLSRVMFAPGDYISDQEGREMIVERVETHNGLVTYHCTAEDGGSLKLGEGKLNNFLQLSQPLQRLVSGQIDSNRLFELRARSQKVLSLLAQSTLQGLTGCRTSLIDHQLYIAHEVSRRFAPRVLLADEVGLGKTIEAGLIMHYQLLNERAHRVLVVVPESLQHQWLVEMMRRFNLMFSIFDEERCSAIDGEESPPDEVAWSDRDNPFHSEQLVLCSLQFLLNNPHRFEQALEGDWDMLVVDEAHHLVWQPDEPSPEYRLVEQLARRTGAVLLLTATPEQLGKESHFARLRLLDADRFSDLNHFLEEEQHYRPVAEIVEALLRDASLAEDQMEELARTVGEGDNLELIQHINDADAERSRRAREQLVEHLLDRHGTGRVLFRNTRHGVQGFPERSLVTYPLPCPPVYRAMYEGFSSGGSAPEPQYLLSPELLFGEALAAQSAWEQFDPRVEWLVEFLKTNRQRKVLIICSSATTALALAQRVKAASGIALATFHEGLSLVERDRAAAWFADRETGTPAMICSEIGSEGRNFQFAHDLVMFDLPYNPDLLEQRIGRLDRIGQSETIKIHVPFIEETAQQVMLDWLHQGLDAFEHTCPVGHSVFMQLRYDLARCMAMAGEDHSGFYRRSAEIRETMNRHLQQGRDRLLEYNSCRPHEAAALREQAETLYLKLNLAKFMEQMYDCYGISYDIHSPGCWVLAPTDNMPARVPGLPDDGMTITYERDIALANEDVRFLTWEHPFVRTLIDMVISSELGNTALLALKYPGVKPGTLLLDCFFRVEIADRKSAGGNAEGQRYLPDNLLRFCIDEYGSLHQDRLSPDVVARQLQLVDVATASKVVKSREAQIKHLLAEAETLARRQLPERQQQAIDQAEQLLQSEVDRLVALRTLNPNVREEEIEFFRQQLQQSKAQIAAAGIRLDALRIFVVV